MSESPTPPTHIATFLFPETNFLSRRLIFMFSPPGDNAYDPSSCLFKEDPTQGYYLFSIDLGGGYRKFSVVVRESAFRVENVPSVPHTGQPPRIPWPQWGPQHSRWFTHSELGVIQPLLRYGSHMASPTRIIDLNPLRVARDAQRANAMGGSEEIKFVKTPSVIRRGSVFGEDIVSELSYGSYPYTVPPGRRVTAGDHWISWPRGISHAF